MLYLLVLPVSVTLVLLAGVVYTDCTAFAKPPSESLLQPLRLNKTIGRASNDKTHFRVFKTNPYVHSR
jgi:hypothetical protein